VEKTESTHSDEILQESGSDDKHTILKGKKSTEFYYCQTTSKILTSVIIVRHVIFSVIKNFFFVCSLKWDAQGASFFQDTWVRSDFSF
jgi:hypothetical protein